MALPRLPVYAKVVAGFVGAVGATTSIIYIQNPSVFISAVNSWQRYNAGFRRKIAILDGGFKLSYAEKGKPQTGVPTLVMLHGFTGSMDAAVSIVKKMPQDVHVISVSAPGHGASSALTEEDLRMRGMAKRIKQFTKKTGLDKQTFHLVGWAMGGTIAGSYAAQYPEDLQLLTIACPGMYCPNESEAMEDVVAGEDHILLPRSPGELQDLMHLLLEKKITLPPKVLQFIFDTRMKRRADHKKVLKYMLEDAMAYDDNLYIKDISRICTPTQLIWGEKDGLIDVSGAHLLEKTLGGNCKRKDIVPKCGHSFFMEEPHTLAGLIIAFQADYRLKKDAWKKQRERPVRKDIGERISQVRPKASPAKRPEIGTSRHRASETSDSKISETKLEHKSEKMGDQISKEIIPENRVKQTKDIQLERELWENKTKESAAEEKYKFQDIRTNENSDDSQVGRYSDDSQADRYSQKETEEITENRLQDNVQEKRTTNKFQNENPQKPIKDDSFQNIDQDRKTKENGEGILQNESLKKEIDPDDEIQGNSGKKQTIQVEDEGPKTSLLNEATDLKSESIRDLDRSRKHGKDNNTEDTTGRFGNHVQQENTKKGEDFHETAPGG